MNKIVAAVLFVLFSFLLPYPVSADSSSNADGDLVIHFIDVGEGDASFIQLPDGDNVLIDTGSPAAGPELVDYLRSLKIRKINCLILTHPHDDHIGGTFSLLPAFEIEKFYDNGFSNFDSTMYFDYVTAIRGTLSKYGVLQAGESLVFHDTKINILNPLLPPAGDPNDDSIVLRLTYRDISILFAGDMSTRGESRLLKVAGDLKSQVLKAGHHGEADALSGEFLEAVGPEAAVLSAALINRYARPHQSVLDRLSRRNIKAYRTDIHGHIILKTDGRTFSITTEK
jgi:competence protein ComEC